MTHSCSVFAATFSQTIFDCIFLFGCQLDRAVARCCFTLPSPSRKLLFSLPFKQLLPTPDHSTPPCSKFATVLH